MKKTIKKAALGQGPVKPKKPLTDMQRNEMGNPVTPKQKKESLKGLQKSVEYKGRPKMKSGGSFPDLNKDGKITKADILKGRGVIAQKGATVKKPLLPAPKKKTAMDAVKGFGKYVSTFGLATEKYNPAPSKAAKKTPKNKMGGMTKKCAYGCK